MAPPAGRGWSNLCPPLCAPRRPLLAEAAVTCARTPVPHGAPLPAEAGVTCARTPVPHGPVFSHLPAADGLGLGLHGGCAAGGAPGSWGAGAAPRPLPREGPPDPLGLPGFPARCQRFLVFLVVSPATLAASREGPAVSAFTFGLILIALFAYDACSTYWAEIHLEPAPLCEERP
ncbi:CKLF-like MARVEL transmembrane domain-containing protein 5 [Carettochelys insculpta]|uniref:CKLF-like MARVEL transmembrane domain-containing protein 5 n=1 Tax=Carettochelys insculpta TaxID=44489 RepID=UPI003EB83A21